MESQPSYYDLLNLSIDASQEEIRRAYHEAARQLHPDVSKNPGSTELFIQVQKAYEVLSDPKARAKYDKNVPKPDETEVKLSANEVQIVGEAITIKITFSRSNLPKIEESQLVYVLLDIIAPNVEGSQASPPINVCLVIDRSTSMSGLRMDTVKATAIELLRQLRPQDTLAVVTFSDRSEVVIPAVRGYRHTEIEGKIRKIQTGGGTELYHGLEAGFYEVRRFLSNRQINHMILLTDGRTYGDEAECIQLADKMASFGISLSTLGIGDEWNDQFLDGLANRTGGSSFYVSHPGDIAEFLKDKFRGLGQIYAEKLLLKMEPSNGVMLQYALRSQPDTLPLPTESLIRLGGLPNDNGIRLLLEFVIAPITGRSQRLNLANCTLTMDIPGLNLANYKVPFKLQRPISQVFQPEGPPNAIIQSVSQLTLYRMQERINQEMIAGNIMDANEIMQHLATQLLARGKLDLASMVLKEAERIKRTQHISEQGKKQIKYGTRALMLPVDLLEDR
jgi:Ca-activated chloride channel homolog